MRTTRGLSLPYFGHYTDLTSTSVLASPNNCLHHDRQCKSEVETRLVTSKRLQGWPRFRIRPRYSISMYLGMGQPLYFTSKSSLLKRAWSSTQKEFKAWYA